MEFDQLVQRLEELRVEAERERFVAAAHQLDAWIWFLRYRSRIYSVRAVETYELDTPPEVG